MTIKIEPAVYKPRGTENYFPCARITWGFAERRITIGGKEETRHLAMKRAKQLLEDPEIVAKAKAHFEART